MDYDDYHFKIKISVMGDKGVGKSLITDGKFYIKN
jgi:GTPase SAR1 family protein